MKKVAISTLFYNNNNYGGMAQAYALQKYIIDLEYDVSLVSYNRTNAIDFYNIKEKNNYYNIFYKLQKKIIKLLELFFNFFYKNRLEKRVNMMSEFRDKFMKHTKVCDKNDISLLKEYDILISGSDQIWRPGVLEDIDVFNSPVCDGKFKFSYASSVAREELPQAYLDYMKENLIDYKAISVRESQSADLFRNRVRKDVEWVVDPTLLLSQEEWNKICSKRLISKKYAFAYILGDCPKQRKIIKRIAKERGLCLVTIPHIKDGWLHKFKMVDLCFGDEKLYSIGLEEFLSLIKHSELVLTDSFHAVSFSTIFHKEFWALDRTFNIEVPSMNSRIYSFLSLTGLEMRFINSYDQYKLREKEVIKYDNVEFRKIYMIEKSKKFILDTLNKFNQNN